MVFSGYFNAFDHHLHKTKAVWSYSMCLRTSMDGGRKWFSLKHFRLRLHLCLTSPIGIIFAKTHLNITCKQGLSDSWKCDNLRRKFTIKFEHKWCSRDKITRVGGLCSTLTHHRMIRWQLQHKIECKIVQMKFFF